MSAPEPITDAELTERPRVGFDFGALLAWMALGLALTLLAVLLSVNVAWWLW